jgi:hypothetical protein
MYDDDASHGEPSYIGTYDEQVGQTNNRTGHAGGLYHDSIQFRCNRLGGVVHITDNREVMRSPPSDLNLEGTRQDRSRHRRMHRRAEHIAAV